jgi:uncharacterized membrane protein YbaN (DUF454 family)
MKPLLIIVGSVCLGLGVIGIFLPLLPTTPFLLLAAACYFRSSETLYAWLLNHRYIGAYIRNFREHRAIPLRAKIISLTLMWGTMTYAILFVASWLWLRILLLLIAVAITVHILSYKTLR